MWPFTKKQKAPEVPRSKHFPLKFYQHKLVQIDDSLDYFVRRSAIVLPKTPLTIKEFKNWSIDADEFEEIIFDDAKYKLLYDKTNDLYYLMERIRAHPDAGTVELNGIEEANFTYEAWSGVMEIKSKNELLSIFNRKISEEADEYLFVELKDSRKFQNNETWWIGVIVQPAMIK